MPTGEVSGRIGTVEEGVVDEEQHLADSPEHSPRFRARPEAARREQRRHQRGRRDCRSPPRATPGLKRIRAIRVAG